MALTLQNLMDEIDLRTKAFGQIEHTGTALQSVIGRELDEWVRLTKCFYSDNIYLSLSSSGPYFFDSQLFTVAHAEGNQTVRMLTIQDVWLDGVPVDEISYQQLVKDTPLYKDSAAVAVPDYWYVLSESAWDFVPQFTGSETLRVAGYYRHPQITSASVPSTAKIVLPEQMQESFINYISGKLMAYNATGERKAESNARIEVGLNYIEQWNRLHADEPRPMPIYYREAITTLGNTR